MFLADVVGAYFPFTVLCIPPPTSPRLKNKLKNVLVCAVPTKQIQCTSNLK